MNDMPEEIWVERSKVTGELYAYENIVPESGEMKYIRAAQSKADAVEVVTLGTFVSRFHGTPTPKSWTEFHAAISENGLKIVEGE